VTIPEAIALAKEYVSTSQRPTQFSSKGQAIDLTWSTLPPIQVSILHHETKEVDPFHGEAFSEGWLVVYLWKNAILIRQARAGCRGRSERAVPGRWREAVQAVCSACRTRPGSRRAMRQNEAVSASAAWYQAM